LLAQLELLALSVLMEQMVRQVLLAQLEHLARTQQFPALLVRLALVALRELQE